ncbi:MULTISPECIES: hypothetical protein [unclassified Myroides]|uniref:hypothetical protein n=1 Tax=unclassified Myroides TaxID=2642485 RepID=UPI003D2F7BD6
MKNYLFAVSSLLLLSVTACKDTGKEPSTITIDGATTEQPASTPTPEPTKEATEEATPAQPTPVASTPATTNQTTAASSKLNPAHGQPGHRCDIPVGTPLDAPAGGGMQTSAAPVAASQGQPFLVNDQAKDRIMQEQGQSASSGKINPPHGQPGHRCDIQVGQPLP